VDVSTEAIQKARARSAAKADFEAINFDEWTPSEPFDCIVFNETLYYATKPMELIRRFARRLSENGVIIASMMRDPWHDRMWRDLDREFLVRHHLSVTNDRRHTFDVKVLSPKPGAGTSATRN
jgi:trans-aconitate methyltransferase